MIGSILAVLADWLRPTGTISVRACIALVVVAVGVGAGVDRLYVSLQPGQSHPSATEAVDPAAAPAATTFLGLPLDGYDREAEARYNAEIDQLSAELAGQQAETADAHAAVAAAEEQAAVLQRTADHFAEQLDTAAGLDEGALVEATAAVDVDALTAVWTARIEATQQIAKEADERSAAAGRIAAALRRENTSLRLENLVLQDTVSAATDRVARLSRSRMRLGFGVTAGVPVLPAVDFSRPAVVAGLSISWS